MKLHRWRNIQMRGLEFFIHHVNRDVRLSRHAHSIIRTKFKRNSSSVFGRNVTKINLLGSTPKKKNMLSTWNRWGRHCRPFGSLFVQGRRNTSWLTGNCCDNIIISESGSASDNKTVISVIYVNRARDVSFVDKLMATWYERSKQKLPDALTLILVVCCEVIELVQVGRSGSFRSCRLNLPHLRTLRTKTAENKGHLRWLLLLVFYLDKGI